MTRRLKPARTTQQSRSKVVVLLESSRASGRALLRGVANYAQLRGGWSFFWEPGGLEEAWPVLRTLDADGIILRDVGKVDEVIASGIPLVVVGHRRSEFSGLVNVVTDSKAVGRLGAEHLLDCGFTHFAFCGLARSGIETTPWSQERADSFSGLLREKGYPTHFFDEQKKKKAPVGLRRELQQLAGWLKSLPQPVGVLACNDDRGQQVIEACRYSNLQVPDQVAVLGVDNDELIAGLSDPPMSSVALNFERAGYESAEALERLIQGRPVPNSKILVRASHVVVRRSTNILAVQDPYVAKALRYIRDHGRNPLSVEDVARAVALSRRALEKRFHGSLQRSILKEIRRTRVALILQLLAGTSHSIAEIADQLGFEGPAHFARYFRSEKGMTPREFRSGCRTS